LEIKVSISWTSHSLARGNAIALIQSLVVIKFPKAECELTFVLMRWHEKVGHERLSKMHAVFDPYEAETTKELPVPLPKKDSC
jgi:hypothetical protein